MYLGNMNNPQRSFRFVSPLVCGVVLVAWVLVAFQVPNPSLRDEESVLDLLMDLGDSVALKYASVSTEPEIIRRGTEIIEEGRTIGPDGHLSDYVSKFYNCTSCHNPVQEDPDLRVSDPEARLAYAEEKGLPFLQATTFYGILNRESWYNEDYYKKYGEWVYPANGDVREAIQLCARECAQGRPVLDWELEAIMAYYRSRAFRVADLGFSAQEKEELAQARTEGGHFPGLVSMIKSKYLTYSPATFGEPPTDLKKGYEGLRGNAERGEKVFTLGCQSCHRPEGVSEVVLDKSRFTFQKLKKNLLTYTNYSIYQIARHGTHPEPGHRPYMPHYTLERMSHQQLEDLRAYIEREAR